jgi:hypothetical protein
MGKLDAPVCPVCGSVVENMTVGRAVTNAAGELNDASSTVSLAQAAPFHASADGEVMRINPAQPGMPPGLRSFASARDANPTGSYYVGVGHFIGADTTATYMETVVPAGEPLPASAEAVLVQVMKLLYITSTSEGGRVKLPTAQGMTELLAAAVNDTSLDHKLLHALGTGQDLPMAAPSDTRQQGTIFGGFVACEVLRRLTNPSYDGAFAGFLTRQLNIHTTATLQSLLVRLKLAAGASVLVKEKGMDIQMQEDFKRKFCAWGALVVAFDNIGMKRTGKDCGYDQWTHILITAVSFESLVRNKVRASLIFLLPFLAMCAGTNPTSPDAPAALAAHRQTRRAYGSAPASPQRGVRLITHS